MINPVGGNSITGYGHCTSQYCVAVGAVDCAAPSIPEDFTSKGGNIPFYFDFTGNAAAMLRYHQNRSELPGPNGAADPAVLNTFLKG